jgi:hypothetical protein
LFADDGDFPSVVLPQCHASELGDGGISVRYCESLVGQAWHKHRQYRRNSGQRIEFYHALTDWYEVCGNFTSNRTCMNTRKRQECCSRLPPGVRWIAFDGANWFRRRVP